jgi:hypothetical protein
MADAEALSFDHILAGGSHIEQQVDQVILQQVDLIDIEKTAMCASQKTRLEGFLAMGQRPFNIERADHAVLGRTKRQVDHRNRNHV